MVTNGKCHLLGLLGSIIYKFFLHIKAVVQKCLNKGEDIQLALTNIRVTPIDSELLSPAKMMFGKPITILLPSRLQPGYEKQRKRLKNQYEEMKQKYDRTAKSELSLL